MPYCIRKPEKCKPLPPAARGTLFEKTVPLDPLQKLFIILIPLFVVFFLDIII
jgi:hypothetical protein